MGIRFIIIPCTIAIKKFLELRNIFSVSTSCSDLLIDANKRREAFNFLTIFYRSVKNSNRETGISFIYVAEFFHENDVRSFCGFSLHCAYGFDLTRKIDDDLIQFIELMILIDAQQLYIHMLFINVCRSRGSIDFVHG